MIKEGAIRYNNDGVLAVDGKYLTYIDYDIDSVYTVDTLRVFSDSASDTQNLLKVFIINGFDILVKENETGEWITVYSVTEPYCGNKYKIYPDENGLRTSYTFKGWFDAAIGGNAITTDTVFTANTTVYAQWNSSMLSRSGVRCGCSLGICQQAYPRLW